LKHVTTIDKTPGKILWKVRFMEPGEAGGDHPSETIEKLERGGKMAIEKQIENRY
jgi:hypothetical protein